MNYPLGRNIEIHIPLTIKNNMEYEQYGVQMKYVWKYS